MCEPPVRAPVHPFRFFGKILRHAAGTAYFVTNLLRPTQSAIITGLVLTFVSKIVTVTTSENAASVQHSDTSIAPPAGT